MAAFRKYTHQEMVKEEENIPFLVKIKTTKCINIAKGTMDPKVEFCLPK